MSKYLKIILSLFNLFIIIQLLYTILKFKRLCVKLFKYNLKFIGDMHMRNVFVLNCSNDLIQAIKIMYSRFSLNGDFA
jgi:hypothetical protein